MSLLVPKRVDQEELLDEHDAPWDEMTRSLQDLRAINRYAGGIRTYRRMLQRAAQARDLRSLRILDLGTGTSDLPASVRFASRPIGLDVNYRHLRYGAKRWPAGVMRVAGDAFALPFRDSSVDVVTSSHFAHHFSPEENVAIVRESLRVARVAVAISDTRRHRAPLLFMKAMGVMGAIGEITKFDGPASVLRGYTVEEVREIASRCGAEKWLVRRVLPFRWVLILWK